MERDLSQIFYVILISKDEFDRKLVKISSSVFTGKITSLQPLKHSIRNLGKKIDSTLPLDDLILFLKSS